MTRTRALRTRTSRGVSFARAFMADDRANATGEYALIASSFAMLTIGIMVAVQTAAAGQLAFTDNALNNRNGVTP